MNRFNAISAPLCALAATLLLSGCGDGRPTRVPVVGRVLIDNQPLEYGSIRFVPDVGRASTGRLDADGRFELTCFESGDGAILGTHQVEIAACESLSATRTRWHAPKKYANYATSGLTQTIDQPADNLTIHLTWDGGQPFDETVDGEEDAGPRQRKRASK